MKGSKTRPRLRKRRTWRVYGLGVLVVCMTLLSLKGQFRSLTILFGGETIIVCAVIEILRCITLYMLFQWSGRKKIGIVVLYIGIAIFSGSQGIIGWYSVIVEAEKKREMKVKDKTEEVIAEIKTLYAKKIQSEINRFGRVINTTEEQIAIDTTNSLYLSKRRAQFLDGRTAIIREREKFLSEKPQDQDSWIKKNAAILELKYTPIKEDDLRTVSIEEAIMKTWHTDADTAKKAMAVVFVFAIEITIVLLSLMTKSMAAGDRDVTGNDGIVGYLTERFDENDIKVFVRKCRDKYDKVGELPKSFELTARLRPIRQAIMKNSYKEKELKELFSHCHENSKYKSIKTI